MSRVGFSFWSSSGTSCRPATKCRGSVAAAGPIVPTMRPRMKSGLPKSMLKPSTLNLIDRSPSPAAARRSVRKGECDTSPHSRFVSTDWYIEPAFVSEPGPAARPQMSVNGAGSKLDRRRLDPSAAAIRTSRPKIVETICCSGSRSTSFAGASRSESATRHENTGSDPAERPSARSAAVISQPRRRNAASPRGLNHPFSAVLVCRS
jgi:hypothetical protein